MAVLQIVALSTPETISSKALTACKAAKRLYLQTEQTPCALPVVGLQYDSMDDLYRQADDFDALQAAIQARLFSSGEDVTYAVPGRAAGEALFTLSREAEKRGYTVETVAGAGYAEAAIDAGQMQYNSFVTAAAATLPQQLDRRLPLVIEELDTAIAASEVKLRLLEYWPDETKLTIYMLGESGHYAQASVPLYMLDRLSSDEAFIKAHPTPYHAATVVYVPPCELLSLERFGYEELEEVMLRLRAPGGCPWDAEQSHESLKRSLIEECYEVLDAIDAKDDAALCEELGDVLLQVVFHAQIAAEQARFTGRDISTGIVEKLIYRHPHVFGTGKADTAEAVLDKWEELKKAEKHFASTSEMMQAIPKNFPALMRGEKVQKKAAKAGFDWDNAADALLKLREETEELQEAMEGGGDIAEEMGDLFFAAVNVARLLKLDSEQTLTNATNKFIRRYTAMEELASSRGLKLEELSLAEQDKLWNEVKKTDKTIKMCQ